MTKKSCLCFFLTVSSLPMLPGCKNQAYFFVSPFNGNNLEYHPIPKVGDSIHTALYSSLTYSNGSANYSGNDYLWSLHSSVHAAHQYDNVQFHYGLGLTLGTYVMGRWQVDTAPAVQLNTYSGPHFFGGVGFQGGINGVMPFDRGEWRYLGVETSVTQEFGNYLAVRKQLPDSIVTLLDRSPLFATAGINTELVGHTRQGEFGFKWAFGFALGHSYSNPGVGDGNGNPLRYKYFNFTFHYTYRRFTSYLQVNDATYANLVFLGIDYRLWAH
jgi:hypothetical protein